MSRIARVVLGLLTGIALAAPVLHAAAAAGIPVP